MPLVHKFRFTMASVMMMVVTAAVASALFAKVREHVPTASMPYLRFDAPILFIVAIVLTAIALGALKGHTPGQVMFQVILCCLGYLSLMTMGEQNLQRPLLYWFQAGFGLLVAGPMVARRIVKNDMERGPRRTWWKGMLEAPIFAFLSMHLVLVGILIQFVAALAAGQTLKF